MHRTAKSRTAKPHAGDRKVLWKKCEKSNTRTSFGMCSKRLPFLPESTAAIKILRFLDKRFIKTYEY
jgi:hypothetical protein